MTCDYNSVVIASIFLHNIMTKATKLNKSLFIRRYIEDTLLISESNTVSTETI